MLLLLLLLSQLLFAILFKDISATHFVAWRTNVANPWFFFENIQTFCVRFEIFDKENCTKFQKYTSQNFREPLTTITDEDRAAWTLYSISMRITVTAPI